MSSDADTTWANWAREARLPGLFGSDTGLVVAKAYGSVGRSGRAAARNIFVIGPDGRISYRVIGFNVLSADAYSALGAAVARAAGGGRE